MEGSRTSSTTIPYEQAVYGSFPFWDKGYAVLAQSPGCRPAWVNALRTACQGFGERPTGVSEVEVSGLFALGLASGPWMIVGVGSPGRDDRGRPGALAFHALFVSPRDYRRLGCDPFVLAGALRNDWTAATRDLPSGTWTFTPSRLPHVPTDPHAERMAAALRRGRRVALEAAAPIDALARQVWHALPGRVRRRATVATWAFANGNRFDLVAVPRLAGIALDASYLDPAALNGVNESPIAAPGAAGDRRRPAAFPILAASAVMAALVSGLAWHRGSGLAPPSAPPTAPATATAVLGPPPPDRALYCDDRIDPEQSRQVAEALLALAERFGVSETDARSQQEAPAALLVLFSDRLRYRGPWLSAAELASLASAPPGDRESALALRWHARIQGFAADRPLPRDFAHGPLRWQIDTLAWSFHLDPVGNRRSMAEGVQALGEALTNDLPLPPIHLSGQRPPLAAYRDFLGRLPRR